MYINNKNRFVSIFILLETGCILKRIACRLMYRLCCPSMARPILLSTMFTSHLLSFWFKCKVPYVGACMGIIFYPLACELCAIEGVVLTIY